MSAKSEWWDRLRDHPIADMHFRGISLVPQMPWVCLGCLRTFDPDAMLSCPACGSFHCQNCGGTDIVPHLGGMQ